MFLCIPGELVRIGLDSGETELHGLRGHGTLALKRGFGCVSMFRQLAPEGL